MNTACAVAPKFVVQRRTILSIFIFPLPCFIEGCGGELGTLIKSEPSAAEAHNAVGRKAPKQELIRWHGSFALPSSHQVRTATNAPTKY